MIDFATGLFSEKALDFMEHSDARLNILHGSVRSSKTVNCSLRWIAYCLDGPPGDLVMVGKTVATLQRNVLNDLMDLVGPKNFKWVDRQKGEIRLLGRRVHLVGANSEDAEGKLRGATFAGALCDEASLYPESFWNMLMTRMSVAGAMVFANCNPGDPDHWFYKNVIMNTKISNKKIWHFTLDDNPNLTAEYRQSLEEMFSGVFHDRMIKGLWVVAEGIIYRKFAENLSNYVIDSIPKNLAFSVIGVDFGGNGSGHAFNCTGYEANLRHIYTLADYWSNKEFDANQLGDEFVRFVKECIAKGLKVLEIRADSENTVLVRTFKNKLTAAGIGIPIRNAIKGTIWNRIQFYSLLIGVPGAYQIHKDCKSTIEALKTARWDPKHPDDRLDDLTTNIDNLDAQEYSTEFYQKQINDVLLLLAGRLKNGSNN